MDFFLGGLLLDFSWGCARNEGMIPWMDGIPRDPRGGIVVVVLW